MYLKSNDEEVVKQLAVPETLFLLDYVRPDLLLLRVLCRSLVMWDSVQPTAEWIESHVPLMLRACMERLRHAAPPLPGHESESSSESDCDAEAAGAGASNVVEVLVSATADEVRVSSARLVREMFLGIFSDSSSRAGAYASGYRATFIPAHHTRRASCSLHRTPLPSFLPLPLATRSAGAYRRGRDSGDRGLGPCPPGARQRGGGGGGRARIPLRRHRGRPRRARDHHVHAPLHGDARRRGRRRLPHRRRRHGALFIKCSV